MSSIFKKIIDGEIPCFKIHENERFLSFLDVNPLKKGHILVIPKSEIDYIFDMDAELLSEFHLYAQKIAIALKKSIECQKVGLAVIGLEVPHAHIHLVPIEHVDDMNFSNKRIQLSKEEFISIAQLISSNL